MDRVEDQGELQIIRIDGWEQYDWLLHGFSTRPGGVSSPYDGSALNLGWTKEDDPKSVAENRRRFIAAVVGETDGDPPLALVGVRQVHSAVVHVVHHDDGALEGKLASADGKAVLEGDGLMTAVPGVLLGVGTADCVPVLVADVSKRVVAAFHAGWRGTAARIVELGVNKMHLEYGSQPEDLVAAVGPSIGACCYSVGEEVRTKFESNFPYADKLFHNVNHPEASGPRVHLDLWGANRRQLLEAGLAEAQITVVGQCSACSRDSHGGRRFFSHRAELGLAGRMLNVVGIAR
jgi:YfiH family protein